MRKLLIALLALPLAACATTQTTTPLAKLHAAGEIACDNREALRAVIEQAAPEQPLWIVQTQAAFDMVCALLGL